MAICCAPNQLYTFIQGACINPDSCYNIWERLGNSGEKEFIEYLHSGPKGDTGISAYQNWLNEDENSSKTFDEFISSFKGPTGDKGPIGNIGDKGLTGDKGLSAYDVWINAGNTGTQSEYLSSLKGDKGDTGDKGNKGQTGDKGLSGTSGIYPDIIDSLIFIDNNGNNKMLVIKDGIPIIYDNLVITITTQPTKTNYTDTEKFDPTGMVVTLTKGNTTTTITNYEYDEYVETGSSTHEIRYTENGITVTAYVNIITRTIEEVLIDFTYTIGEDGTYYINGWKGTYNGSPSTECILPNTDRIVI